MKFVYIAQAAAFFASLAWAAPTETPAVMEAISIPWEPLSPSDTELSARDAAHSTLTTRVPIFELRLFLNFQSTTCSAPFNMIIENVDTGRCYEAVQGGLIWAIRSGLVQYQGPNPEDPFRRCQVHYFQNRGCAGSRLVVPYDNCVTNPLNGAFSFRVVC